MRSLLSPYYEIMGFQHETPILKRDDLKLLIEDFEVRDIEYVRKQVAE